MNKKEIAKLIKKHLDQAWEDIEKANDGDEEHYACGWIDACNTILKGMGEPTPTDVETIFQSLNAS